MTQSHGRGLAGVVRALLPGETPAVGESRLLDQLEQLGPAVDASAAWLLLAALGREFPMPDEVVRFRRDARTVGIRSALFAALRSRTPRNDAEILDAPVLVDVHETATHGLLTGVQRVARAVGDDALRRDAILVAWRGGRLRRVDPAAWSARRRSGALRGPAVVPSGGHYVLAEVVGDVDRAARIQALAESKVVRTGVIGFDAIPLTTAETTGSRMAGTYAKHLAASSRMDWVGTISEAAAIEYRGWRAMLPAAGIQGPEIRVAPIARTAVDPDPAARTEAERRFLVADERGVMPLVVCVGSHEPRKNHDGVLHAAEMLWRAGARFSLTFIGGNAWSSSALVARIAELRRSGRPVSSLRGVTDAQLGWAYRMARLTVFPSFNEGFGLPVVESLAAGTPVVTSDFGSMAELAAHGGCVLVDPRDDRAIAEGIRRLLEDDELHAELAARAASAPLRSWSEYTDEVWAIAGADLPASRPPVEPGAVE